tara:strand:- start:115 stop:303 length:189 start_codon:yes stop_codon:yes gene_type:complete
VIPFFKPAIYILIIFLFGFGIYRFGFFNIMKKYPTLRKTLLAFIGVVIVFLIVFLYIEINNL